MSWPRKENAGAGTSAFLQNTLQRNPKDTLDRLLAPKLFEIWTQKYDGRRRFYQAYADRAVADSVVRRLQELGLPCEIRLARKRAQTT